MAKTSERRIAKQHYLKGKSQKEIAALVSVQEKTIGGWVKKYGWKAELEARTTGQQSQIKNIKAVISGIAVKRLAVQKKIDLAIDQGKIEKVEKLQKEAATLDDGVSKWNKTLESLDSKNKVSLATYIEVMDDIFKSMSDFDTNLFIKSIDFQEKHIATISLKLG